MTVDRAVLVAVTLLSLALGQFGVIRPGQNCSATSSCLRDFYNCRTSVCAGGVCAQSNVPAGTSCADLRNASNWDECIHGICVGSAYASSWVRFALDSTAPFRTLFGSYEYPFNVQQQLVNLLSLSNATDKPGVRVCLDYTQRLVGVVENGNTNVIRTCNLVMCPSGQFPAPCGSSAYLFVEFVAGPNGLNHTNLAQQAAVLANGSALTNLFIQSGYVSPPPFGGEEFIPWINGVYLGISIGVACGLFLVTLMGCVAFYWIKSSREVYGAVVGSTDSTASVQSGSSMRSDGESLASGASSAE